MTQSRTITVDEFHTELTAQGVRHPRHYALKCPICDTIQSMASLVVAGASIEEAEKKIGFSCIGRITNAGAWPQNPNAERRKQGGCDWSLGGLFSLHTLEVIDEDGDKHPRFEIATAEEAQELQDEMAAKLTESNQATTQKTTRRILVQELILFDAALNQRVIAAGDDYSSEEWEKLYDDIFGPLQDERNLIFNELKIGIPDYYDPDTTYGEDGMAWITAHLEASNNFYTAEATGPQEEAA